MAADLETSARAVIDLAAHWGCEPQDVLEACVYANLVTSLRANEILLLVNERLGN